MFSAKELFFYNKARAVFVYHHQKIGMRNSWADILQCLRYYANSDGWVFNSVVSDHIKHEIKQYQKARYKNNIDLMIQAGIIEMRSRSRHIGRKQNKGINEEDGGKSGELIELRLTLSGMLLMDDFDRTVEKYINNIAFQRGLKARAGEIWLNKLDDGWEEKKYI